VLLLDNVEDLNPEAESWLSTLLADGSSVRILATSQRRIPGWERETLNLSPLRWRTKSSADVRKSESAQLLARQADLDLDEIPVHELAEAVRLLGGVPLAIQLFAAQLRKEPLASAVAALAANQTDAIGVFDHPEQRHQNFAACVNWSLSVAGPVVESNLVGGRQDLVPGKDLAHGQSITDACLGWEESLRLLDRLAEAVRRRRAAFSPATS
jgi:hypothetical protein